MRNPSQDFLEIQANIKQAKAHLLAMSQLLSCWKEFNEGAINYLATAAKWENEEAEICREGQALKQSADQFCQPSVDVPHVLAMRQGEALETL